ncbi:MAG: endoglucanase [Arenicella sp.]|jgi:endoglucanase
MQLKISLLICLLYSTCGIANAGQVSVYAVDTNVLAVVFLAGKVDEAKQVGYFPQTNDRLNAGNQRHQWLYRNNRPIGALVGRHRTALFGFDKFMPASLRTKKLDQSDSYSLSSQGDPNFLAGVKPADVSRKSKPINLAYTGIWRFDFPVKHIVYLHFNSDLQAGASYALDLSALSAGSVNYHHQPTTQFSESVHVSQIGFRPNDPYKAAYLSLWKGSLGGHDYGSKITYFVKDLHGKQVLTGNAKPSYQPQADIDERLTKTPVYRLAFDSITQHGNYQVCVTGVGCSYSFEISNSVWDKALKKSFRGLYNQRSGIAITNRPGAYSRKKNMHPDNGVIVQNSKATIVRSKNGLNLGKYPNNFEDLLRGATPVEVKNAIGGYADAGDWDRRIQHLKISRLLSELMEVKPDFMSALTLNLSPNELSNDLPDILDEALWAVMFFARLQSPDGGVRGGVESAEHPRHGEGSWQESQRVFAYSPDPWASLLFAASAAKVSRQLSKYDEAAAKTLLANATRAANWAEKALVIDRRLRDTFQVRDARNIAAVELYAATGSQYWHQLFLQTSAFTQTQIPVESFGKHSQSDASFTYARLAKVDQTVRNNILSAFKITSATLALSIDRTPFGWAMNNPDEWVGWGSLSVPQVVNLIRFNELEPQDKALAQIMSASQFGLGANPSNLSFTTGVGHNYPQHPLHHDHRVSGQPVPFGLTVNGPHDVKRLANHWLMPMLKSAIYPAYEDWPLCESYLDIYSFAPMTEFSVHNTIAPNLYVWAYLASS